MHHRGSFLPVFEPPRSRLGIVGLPPCRPEIIILENAVSIESFIIRLLLRLLCVAVEQRVDIVLQLQPMHDITAKEYLAFAVVSSPFRISGIGLDHRDAIREGHQSSEIRGLLHAPNSRFANPKHG